LHKLMLFTTFLHELVLFTTFMHELMLFTAFLHELMLLGVNDYFELYYLLFHLICIIRFTCISLDDIANIYISRFIRYYRACGSYQDRGLMLTRKLLNQGFLLVKMK
jgi:hypothetical protein